MESHAIARAAFRMGGLFAAGAAVWAVVVLVAGGSWWGPLHTFLTGTVLLAISGASQMFTITWAAAPAPSRRTASAQRWAAVIGAAAAVAGVSMSSPVLTWLGAGALTAALVTLGWSIRRTVARSLLRRFDLSSRFYLLAFTCGAIGVSLGGMLGSGIAGDAYATMRLVHSHLNLVGLVGLTIVGTLPTFLPTVAHHRAVSGTEAVIAWWSSVVGALMIAAALWAGTPAVGVGTLLVGGAAALVLGGIVARLWERGRSRLAFLQVSAGTLWLVAWAVVDGLRVVMGRDPVPFDAWTAAVTLAGVAQVLAGSLAYLLPVLAGPPLGDNETRMTRHGWAPLALANLAGVAAVAGVPAVAVVCCSLWGVDFGRRVLLLRR